MAGEDALLVAQVPHYGLLDAEAFHGLGNADPGIIVDEPGSCDPVQQFGALLAKGRFGRLARGGPRDGFPIKFPKGQGCLIPVPENRVLLEAVGDQHPGHRPQGIAPLCCRPGCQFRNQIATGPVTMALQREVESRPNFKG